MTFCRIKFRGILFIQLYYTLSQTTMPATQINDEIKFVLHPNLRDLDYNDNDAIIALNRQYAKIDPIEPILHISLKWKDWKGILDYLACVEEARQLLKSFPSDKESLYTMNQIEIKYHSTAMIFFCQATLDILAVWLKEAFNLDNVKNSNVAFHKEKFKEQLTLTANEFTPIFDTKGDFILTLSEFRNEWIHRFSGGAMLTTDDNINDPNAIITIQSPITPRYFEADNDREKVEKMNAFCIEKYGKTLYRIEEYADIFADNTKNIVLEILQVALNKL